MELPEQLLSLSGSSHDIYLTYLGWQPAAGAGFLCSNDPKLAFCGTLCNRELVWWNFRYSSCKIWPRLLHHQYCKFMISLPWKFTKGPSGLVEWCDFSARVVFGFSMFCGAPALCKVTSESCIGVQTLMNPRAPSVLVKEVS